jgi:uncharacterized repeat protein (TIGR04138 family)
MCEEHEMIRALRQVVREEGVYPLEAYLFVYQALESAQRAAGERRHVSGQEMAKGFRTLVRETFGPLALMVLNHWRLTCTGDLGRMVFHLVERDLMGKTDDDHLDDFEDVYDFEEAFAPESLYAAVDPRKLAPTYKIPARDLPSCARAAVNA